jgi:hypothetical protein
MRIGQLARRLGIPPSDILGFVGSDNIETEAGTNSRLSDELVTKVINHFAPERLTEIVPQKVTEIAPEKPAETIESLPEEETVIEELPEVTTTEESIPLPPEVIRVAKVELQGLKVIGKIDLPEKKKKEEPKPEDEQQPLRRDFQRNNSRRDREWVNPIEQKRMQETRQAEKKRKENEERAKEKRANHYYSKVKSVPTKAVRRFEEQTVVEDVEVREPSKGLIGKFLRWLRS